MKWPARDRHVLLARAVLLGWGAHAFYALACAWPEVGGWPVPPGWVFVVACLVYGLAASRWGFPVLAGCASGCLAAPLLRAAVESSGPGASALGFMVATAAMVALTVATADLDDDGTFPADEAATLQWLAGMVADGLGVVLTDVAAWVLC